MLRNLVKRIRTAWFEFLDPILTKRMRQRVQQDDPDFEAHKKRDPFTY